MICEKIIRNIQTTTKTNIGKSVAGFALVTAHLDAKDYTTCMGIDNDHSTTRNQILGFEMKTEYLDDLYFNRDDFTIVKKYCIHSLIAKKFNYHQL